MTAWTLGLLLAWAATAVVAGVALRRSANARERAARAATAADTLSVGTLSDFDVSAIERHEDELGELAGALARLHGRLGQLQELEAAARSDEALRARVAAIASELVRATDASAAHIEQIKEAGPAQRAAAEQTAAAMEEMASQIQNVAQASEQIAGHASTTAQEIEAMVEANEGIAKGGAQVMETVSGASATMETMAESVVRVAQTADALDDVARRVAAEATSGKQLLDSSAHKLSAVSERTKESSIVIETLVERSNQIGSISQVIEAIADQTNLLALNAAIEAARAGDAGRGFAVVADEVRKLAERAMTAAQDIRRVVESVQADHDQAVRAARSNVADIAEGAEHVVHTSGGLMKIMSSIEEVTSQVGDVRAATQEQSAAADDVMHLARNMKGITRWMVDSAREHADSSHNVLASAQAIAGMIQQVADASAQQKVAGEQILAAIEHVTEGSTRLVEHIAGLDRADRTLVGRAEALMSAAEPPARTPPMAAEGGRGGRRGGREP